MAKVVLQIPDDVGTKLDLTNGGAGAALRLAAAFSLCERGDLSTSLVSGTF